MSNTIPSPYNFATVEDKVVLLEESEHPSVDVPFRDALSGSIEVTFEATRPLYIRGAGKYDKKSIGDALGRTRNNPEAIASDPVLGPYSRPYQLPDGTFALPGTSVKGMLRSVVEILSFSRMFGVQDDRFGIRDLQSKQTNIYKGWITSNSPNGFRPKTRAAWMYLGNDGEWHLQPCQHGRIEHHFLRGLRPDKLACKMYEAWKQPLDIYCEFEDGPWQEVRIHSKNAKGDLAMSYVKGFAPQPTVQCTTPATLVFTGCPTHNKHREFVFERFQQDHSDPVIPATVVSDFLFLHEDQEDWKGYWKSRFLRKIPVPVFYLATESDHPSPESTSVEFTANRHLHSLGLCQMHRLAYARRVRDLLPKAHKNTSGMDIAEAIFGRISNVPSASLRGRVHVEPFPALGSPQPMPPHLAVLNSPKASYFPNYLQQTVDADGHVKEYKTYHDSDAVLRGWKRYPARADDAQSRPLKNDPPEKNGKVNISVATVFAPLPPGTSFSGVIRFHNLRTWELGAILWALRLGHSGDPEQNVCRHSIGMAKPLGCGLIRLTAIRLDTAKKTTHTEKDLMEAFESFVLARLPDSPRNYREIPQVKDFLAMASVKKPKDPHLLSYPSKVTEFARFKKKRRCLPPFL